MAKKPVNLTYGLNDRPATGPLLLLGLQHVFIFFIAVIFPVLIVRALGDTIDNTTARSFVSLSMFAGGLLTILQAVRKGPLGSGFLLPEVSGPSYLSSSLLAVKLGGLPLLFGMTAVVGVVEILFSRIMHRLRFLFPSEVTGVIVLMVGIVVVPLSMENLFGLSADDTVIELEEVVVGLGTLALMIGFNVFGKGKLRLYSVLFGMAAGYVLAIAFGVLTWSDFDTLEDSPVFAVPYIPNMSWRIDLALLIPFTVAALSSTLKTVGDLVTCQKANDAQWKRPDMKSISRGILVDGLGGLIPGLIGGFGQSTSSTNVGLSIATGATSRWIAYSAGGIFIFLAFLPKFSNLFLLMPKPVVGATLLFAISFMIIAGMQVLVSRMMDARKTFVVSISIMAGLSVDFLPHIYDGVHSSIQPIFSSSLSLATVMAVILNLLLRIGIPKHKTLVLGKETDEAEKLYLFFEKQGGAWGARREVITGAITASNEVIESIRSLELPQGDVELKAAFTEFSLDVHITYRGPLLEIAEEKPTPEELALDERAVLRLSGFMMRRLADKVEATQRDGRSTIHLHFEH